MEKNYKIEQLQNTQYYHKNDLIIFINNHQIHLKKLGIFPICSIICIQTYSFLLVQNIMSKNININKIASFISDRIYQLQRDFSNQSDILQQIRVAVSQVTYAQILKKYLNQSNYVFDHLIKLAKVYISAQCYEQALIQARLAQKEALQIENGLENKAALIIAEAMIKQNRYQDAYQILSTISNEGGIKIEEEKKQYLMLMLEANRQLCEESRSILCLEEIQQMIKQKNGEKSLQYAFFLVNKGTTFGCFKKYQVGLEFLREAIEIFIEKRCKDKKEITRTYLIISDYYRKLNCLDKQYSSLICACSMARQLDQPSKQSLPIIHKIVNNLISRNQNQKALIELKKANCFQKQIYGQSSNLLGKTTKKIIEILNKLNLKQEAKKYEQQYIRIMGGFGHTEKILKEKSTNVQQG